MALFFDAQMTPSEKKHAKGTNLIKNGLLLFFAPLLSLHFYFIGRHTCGCICKELNSRFLFMQGPELMNKYVGESERAVREVRGCA